MSELRMRYRSNGPDMPARNTANKYYNTSSGLTTVIGPFFSDASGGTGSTCVDETHPGPPFKTGGPLTIIHSESSHSVTNTGWLYTGKLGYYRYYVKVENWCCTEYPSSLMKPSALSTLALNGLGTNGWGRCAGLKPHMDLNQSLAEAREIPRLVRSLYSVLKDIYKMDFATFKRTYGTSRSGGSGYLGFQFGVMPIISDIADLLGATDALNKRIKYIKQRNHKTRHCRIELLNESDSDSFNGNISVQNVSPKVPTNNLTLWRTAPWPYSAETTLQKKAWIEGRFGFHLPGVDPFTGDLSTLRKLDQALGINLSLFGLLRTAYQVTPWSWLADWAVNVGDILANVVAVRDRGVYSKYAYLMYQQEWSQKTSQTFTTANYATTVTPSTTRKAVVKQRIAASPFGFGIKSEGLDAFQTSILVALGLSRKWS